MIANRGSGNEYGERNGQCNKCFVCKKTCNYACSRCGEIYCSKQCQTADWREHKYNCFEMPELIMLSPAQNGHQAGGNLSPHGGNRNVNGSPRNRMNDRRGEREQPYSHQDESPQPALKKSTFTYGDLPKCNDNVVLTFIKKANVFYVRTCSSDSEYQKNAKDFDQWGQNGRRLLSLPQRNDVVLVRDSSKFHRASVVEVISEIQIKVGLVDTGRLIHKPLTEMRQISGDLKNRKRYNFLLHLEHLPTRLDRELHTKLHDFVRDGTVFIIQFDGDDWGTASNFKLLEKNSGLPIEMVIKGKRNDGVSSVNSKVETNNGAVSCNGSVSSNDDDSSNCAVSRNGSVTTNGAPTTRASATHQVKKPVESLPVHHSDNGPVESNQYKEELSRTKKVTLHDLTTETLPNRADLIIIDNSGLQFGYVSAIERVNGEKSVSQLEKNCDYGDANHHPDEIYTPEPDEVCLVKFQSEWYRAINFHPKYLLIDFGSLETIDAEDVIRLPAELTEPCYTFVCNIDGFTKDRLEDFQKLFGVDMDKPHLNSICVKAGDDPNEYDVTFAAVRGMLEK